MIDTFKKLTFYQNQQFQRLKQIFPSDHNTLDTCIHYYLQYKQRLGYPLSDNQVPLAFKCAFYMAQKSQTTTNLKGQKIKAIGLSLSELLKSHKLDDIMIMLKDFSKKVKIIDQDVQNDLISVIKQISFLITFYNKFDKIIQKLQLKERVGESFGYTKTFLSYIWLLYALAKNNVLNRSLDLIENTCILAQTISFMLTHAWDHIRPTLLYKQKTLSDQSGARQITYCIKQKVCSLFLITNFQTYKPVAKGFQDFFNNLVASKLIKCSSKTNDFLSPQLINTNYKKLDNYFQKSLNPYDIDERIFHKERTANLTPSKFTPFSRQGYANKGNKPKLGNQLSNNNNDKQNFNSHRILTYELMDKQQDLQQKNMNVAQMKFPINVMQTPSTYKAPLICATPITAGMQMYNYLTEKVRKMQNKFTIDPAIENVLSRIILKQKKDSQRGGKLQKKKMIACFHQYLVQQFTKTNPSQYTDSVYRAFLILSTELVFFISNISITFEDIENQIEADILDQWRVCDYLIKMDRSMPQTLKVHLIDIQVSIISYKIWKDPELVQMLEVCVLGEQSENENIDRCLRTVLVQIGIQINQMSKALQLDDKMSEGVFDTMKQILMNHINIIQNRHLDQLIICSFYVNCRVAQIDVKFNEIKEKYEQVNPYNKSLHQQLIFKVYMEQDQPVDIIKFYNSIFISNLKKFTKTLQERGNGNIITNNQKKNLVLQSPLKTIIPKDMNRPKKLMNGKSIMTPQTQLLYAYNQSPFLRADFNHNFKAKQKDIKFQEIKDQNVNKKYQEDEKLTPNTSQVNPKDFLNKHFFGNNNKKIGNENSSLINQGNNNKPSPLLSKGSQSPISVSKLSQYGDNGVSYQNRGNNENRMNSNNLNNLNNGNSMIPMRLTPTNQINNNLIFNGQINKKLTHMKAPSGTSFASLQDRRFQ